MKRLIVGLVILSVSAMGAFAGGQGEADELSVGLVNINLEALFFNEIYDGAQDAADENGIELVHFDGQNDPGRQVEGIEDLTARGVDAIIIVAIDVDGVIPALEDAKALGIPVVAIDAEVQNPPADTFVGVGNYDAAYEHGEFIASFIEDEYDGSAQVGIVGALNSFIQNQRQDGFRDALVDSGLDIDILNITDGQNQQEIAMQASEDLVTANPEMDLVFATGEPALIGAVAAAESAGYQDDILITGWDLSVQAIRGIDEGFVHAVVQQDPYTFGARGVELALELAAGESVDETVFIPTTIVTQENIDDFRATFE